MGTRWASCGGSVWGHLLGWCRVARGWLRDGGYGAMNGEDCERFGGCYAALSAVPTVSLADCHPAELRLRIARLPSLAIGGSPLG